MNKPYQTTTLLASSLLLLLATSSVARSQIQPDNSLPNNSQVTPNGSIFQIDGGTVAGSNLFHSFQEFSVPIAKEAFFNNATTIDNIITRVTGRNFSNIDGLIRANGTANLFLLNPNGIVFGPNARLDIGGSFFGTTANSIVFQDGVEFSATAPEAPPLLTINVPVGLQFGENSGTVEVRGEGHHLATSPRNPELIDRSQVLPNLEVRPDRTLALLGSSVNLTGSTVSAIGGHLELGSPRTGTVGLTSQGEAWNLDYADISAWGDIRLSQQALADASSLQVYAGTLELRDGSLLLLENSSTSSAGDLRVEAADTILATGTTGDGSIFSGITTQTLGSGDGANVEIEADRLRLEEGAAFQSTTFGRGNSSRWQVNIDSSIEIVGFSPFGSQPMSTLETLTWASGDAGEIALATQQLRIVDGGLISASSFGSGTGSNISIVAESVEITGSRDRFSSRIGASSFGNGDAGSIEIDTVRLILSEGSSVSAAGFAEGNGGSIRISATESISISGVSPINLPSQVRAEVRKTIPSLRRRFGLPDIPSGEAGNVVIETPSLYITDSAQISVANEGNQAAGTLEIRADAIRLNNRGSLIANTASGEGGNIALQVQDSLQLSDRGEISAEAGGTGNGGNVAIDTGTIALLENSRITANAFEGNGGNIQIATQGNFLSANSRITASSQLGVNGIVQITTPEVDSAAALIELLHNPLDSSDRIVASCSSAVENSFVITGRGGLPPSPLQQPIGNRPWVDLRELSAFQGESTASLPQENPPTKLVEANGWIVQPEGQIELVAFAERGDRPIAGNLQTQQLSSPNCAAR